jgi:hypothetical protein
MAIIDRISNKARKWFGVWSLFWGAIWLLGVIATLEKGNNDAALFSATLCAISTALGIYLVRSSRKREQNILTRSLQTKILNIAANQGGLISPVDIARRSNMTVSEAREHLNALQIEGVFDFEITDQGGMLYRLIDYRPGMGRRSAPPPAPPKR